MTGRLAKVRAEALPVWKTPSGGWVLTFLTKNELVIVLELYVPGSGGYSKILCRAGTGFVLETSLER